MAGVNVRYFLKLYGKRSRKRLIRLHGSVGATPGIDLTDYGTIDDRLLVDLIGGQGVASAANFILRLLKDRGETVHLVSRDSLVTVAFDTIATRVRTDHLHRRSRLQNQGFRSIDVVQAGEHLPRSPRTPCCSNLLGH